jgi:DNA-binding transcriptional ArsR family regulator
MIEKNDRREILLNRIAETAASLPIRRIEAIDRLLRVERDRDGMTVGEAVRRLGIPERTLRRHIADGTIKTTIVTRGTKPEHRLDPLEIATKFGVPIQDDDDRG